MVQWIYTEYLGIYTQYLIYFASILILLTSAAAISLIKAFDDRNTWVISFFSFSLLLALFDVYLVFEIYDWLRTTVLFMSDQCLIFNGDMACDMNIQEHSSYLKSAIIAMIISFILLVLGYLKKDTHNGKNKILIKLVLCLFIPTYINLVFASSRYKTDNDINIQVGGSYFLMDKALVSDGYNLKKGNASVLIIYKDKPIPMNEFYMSSIGPDKAIKLYVELSHTLKNTSVFLNAKPLTKTDANGVAFVEKHKQAGPYELKISDNQKSLNYFFSLDKSMKLVCEGMNNFTCSKISYH